LPGATGVKHGDPYKRSVSRPRVDPANTPVWSCIF